MAPPPGATNCVLGATKCCPGAAKRLIRYRFTVTAAWPVFPSLVARTVASAPRRDPSNVNDVTDSFETAAPPASRAGYA